MESRSDPWDYPTESELDRQFRAAQRLLPALVEEEPPVTQTPQMKGMGFPEQEVDDERQG